MENELESILRTIVKNPCNRIRGKEIFMVLHCDNDCEDDVAPSPVITVDSNEKYAVLYSRDSKDILQNKLKELFNYLNENEYVII